MVANQKKYTDEFMLFDAEDVVSVLFGEAFAPAGDVVKPAFAAPAHKGGG